MELEFFFSFSLFSVLFPFLLGPPFFKRAYLFVAFSFMSFYPLTGDFPRGHTRTQETRPTAAQPAHPIRFWRLEAACPAFIRSLAGARQAGCSSRDCRVAAGKGPEVHAFCDTSILERLID